MNIEVKCEKCGSYEIDDVKAFHRSPDATHTWDCRTCGHVRDVKEWLDEPVTEE